MKIDHNVFPLVHEVGHADVKDPCPVYAKGQWHIFGSGGNVKHEQWGVYHMVGPTETGPWTVLDPIYLDVPGSGVAAPGVIYDEDEELFIMYIQTEFMKLGGRIHYLTSPDGRTWKDHGAVLDSIGTDQAGIYDPHPAIINGWKVMVYSGFAEAYYPPNDKGEVKLKVQPDIFLAYASEWGGPWIRAGMILSHEELDHHNPRDHHDYEWGLEGAHLSELKDGRVLLTAVCFLPDGPKGSRQRVFMAIAPDLNSPFVSLGPVLPVEGHGENGHATVVVDDEGILLFYQQRTPETENKWRYGVARGRVWC